MPPGASGRESGAQSIFEPLMPMVIVPLNGMVMLTNPLLLDAAASGRSLLPMRVGTMLPR